MYPFVRSAMVVLSERRKSPLGVFDTHRMTMRCLPWDADMYIEMNNGRIPTLYDLGRFGLSARTGLLDVLKQESWGLVVAGYSMRFRARIRPFQTFELRTRFLGFDDRFFYLEQAMFRGDTCCNHGLLRTGITTKGRLTPVEDVAVAMKIDTTSPPLPDWVQAWAEADKQRPWPPEL